MSENVVDVMLRWLLQHCWDDSQAPKCNVLLQWFASGILNGLIEKDFLQTYFLSIFFIIKKFNLVSQLVPGPNGMLKVQISFCLKTGHLYIECLKITRTGAVIKILPKQSMELIETSIKFFSPKLSKF